MAQHSSPYLSHDAARWLHILITLPLPKYIQLKHLKVPRVLRRGEVSWQTTEQNATQSYAAQGGEVIDL